MRKNLYIFLLVGLIAGGVIVFSRAGRSYDDQTTHPGLTDEIVDFYNLSLADQISGEEKEWVVRGSIEEDTPPRWINHFYDPTTGDGWLAENLGSMSPTTLLFITKTLFNPNVNAVSSLNWLHNEELQAQYASYGGNNTWENGIRQYAKGNKREAYQILGHILHLLEDKTVPDHTRNDTHAHEWSAISSDGGSPYEDYGLAYTRETLKLAEALKNVNRQPVLLGSPDQYLLSLADYSNQYFFSEHTINSPKYAKPKILRQDGKYGYGKDINGQEFPLTRVKSVFDTSSYKFISVYSLIDGEEADDTVLSAYFSRLSSAAVLNGAGLIKLFKDEAEKAANDQNLIQAEPQVSWWKQLRSPAYGVVSILKETKTAFQNLIGKPVIETAQLAAKTTNQTGYALAEIVEQTAVLGKKIINTAAKPITAQNLLAPKPAGAQVIITQNPTSLTPTDGKEQTTITIPGAAPKPFPIWLFSGGSTPAVPATPPLEGNGTTTPLDTIAPNLTISNAPAPYISTTTAEFEFTADETPIRFACRLDGGDWQACQASTTFENLAEGNHLLEAIAIDAANNQSVIASSTWLIDLTLPTATINPLATEYAQTGFVVEWSGEDPRPTPAVPATPPQEGNNSPLGEGCPQGGVCFSGLFSFDLKYQVAASGSPVDGAWQTWLTATTATSSIFDQAATSGDVIFFRVRANDRAGNIGVWSEAQTKITVPPPPPVVDKVVISEIYGGGGNTGSVYKNDFIELYNPTDHAISLDGWSVQYAAATGVFDNRKTNLTGSIDAKAYYLIQESAGSGGTTNLPAPDASGTIAMAATAGKVVLATKQSAISGKNDPAVMDFVGYGSTASEHEGSGPAPAPSNTASIERMGEDTDNNNNDFVVRDIPRPQSALQPSGELICSLPVPSFSGVYSTRTVIANKNTAPAGTPDEPVFIVDIATLHQVTEFYTHADACGLNLSGGWPDSSQISRTIIEFGYDPATKLFNGKYRFCTDGGNVFKINGDRCLDGSFYYSSRWINGPYLAGSSEVLVKNFGYYLPWLKVE